MTKITLTKLRWSGLLGALAIALAAAATASAAPGPGGPFDTSTAITAVTPNPVYIFQDVTVSVRVSATDPQPGMPSGTVEVRSGRDVVCLIDMDLTGKGSCTLTFETPGSVPLEAVYTGTNTYLPSVSAQTLLTVKDKHHPVAIVDRHTPDPSVVHWEIGAGVRLNSIGPIPTGQVTLYRSNEPTCTTPAPATAADRCTATLGPDGTADCLLPLNELGKVYICAAYSGDAFNYAAASAAALHRVGQTNTFTEITRIDPSPSVIRQPVWVYYQVLHNDFTPTGQVTVTSGPDQCTGTVEAGRCALTFTRPHLQEVTAAYSGGQMGKAKFYPSVSDPVTQRVNSPPHDLRLDTGEVLLFQLPGGPVGTLSVQDENPDEGHEYALVPGAGGQHNDYFAIEGDRLVVRTSLPRFVKKLSVRVQASDPAGLTAEAVFSLRVVWGGPGLPGTGFPAGRVTTLPEQPADNRYADEGELTLEIPALGLATEITGVPLGEDGWDTTWLGAQAGWLHGTAFPSWAGNSAIAAHNFLPSGLDGPFAKLGTLGWGDQVLVHAYGNTYVYEVRSVEIVAPEDGAAFKHEEKAWLTLITCKSYDEEKQEYRWRVVVRAVLVEVR